MYTMMTTVHSNGSYSRDLLRGQISRGAFSAHTHKRYYERWEFFFYLCAQVFGTKSPGPNKLRTFTYWLQGIILFEVYHLFPVGTLTNTSRPINYLSQTSCWQSWEWFSGSYYHTPFAYILCKQRCQYRAVILKMWSLTSSTSITWELVRNAKFGCTQDLLNPKFWQWAKQSALINLSGDSNMC